MSVLKRYDAVLGEWVPVVVGKQGPEGNARVGMEPDVYDPNKVEGDVFHMDNMVEGSDTKILTGAERAKLNDIQPGAQVNEVTSVAGKAGAVTLVPADVGLGNVNNTSDANKPISNATAAALAGKVDKVTGYGLSQENYTTEEKAKLGDLATNAELRDRTTHTGEQAISTITGLQAALDGKQATLVSGTSIKTLAGISPLGSGDIPVWHTGNLIFAYDAETETLDITVVED